MAVLKTRRPMWEAILIAAAVLVTVPWSASAQASAVVAAYDDPVYGYSYLPGGEGWPKGSLVIRAGMEITFVNLEQEHHSMTAVGRGPNGLPLFDSGLRGFLEQSSVRRVPDLPTGTYGFFCLKHAFQQGTLVVIE